MINAIFDDRIFFKDMENIIQYSEGYLQGVYEGRGEFMHKIAMSGIEIFKEFVDQQARADVQMYHHIYEWDETGSANARLFDVSYVNFENRINFEGILNESKTVQQGSYVPFYNKAVVMENGLPVVIRPTKADVLAFNVNGEEVFTPNEVVVEHPGGTKVVGAYQHIFNIFFKEHFKQSVLELTGIKKYMQNSKIFKTNLKYAKTGGRAKGIETGYDWIAKAGDLSV